MELRHLHAFVTVAELLSFGRAARQLHLSQPPLTRQIQALEEELGVRLLERGSRRQIALTEVGRLFLADAKQALCLVEDARKRVHAYTCPGRKRLVIANYSLLSAWVLPECLRAFRPRCPQVEIFTLEMSGAENCVALEEGRVHLGLIADHGLEVDGGLRSEVLLTMPLIAVLSTDHPLARGHAPELNMEALAGEDHSLQAAGLCALLYAAPARTFRACCGHPADPALRRRDEQRAGDGERRVRRGHFAQCF